uniref:Uncharacterized protein n=1 Tax=Arundo donax TaxID=35708 RepID=A0A0A9ALF0_ARUDO
MSLARAPSSDLKQLECPLQTRRGWIFFHLD